MAKLFYHGVEVKVVEFNTAARKAKVKTAGGNKLFRVGHDLTDTDEISLDDIQVIPDMDDTGMKELHALNVAPTK